MSDNQDPTGHNEAAGTAPDVFVVGAPRSGTTWLQRLIASHPEVASPQETFFFSHYAAPLVAQFAKHNRHLDVVKQDLDGQGVTKGRVNGLAAILSDEDITSWLACGWELVRSRTLDLKPESRVVVEKSPPHGAQVPLLRRVSPGCRIVHIIRDPRRAARSQQQAPWNSGALTELVRSARTWQQFVRKAKEAGSQSADYHEVRYEDLMRDTAAQLGNILSFIGLDSSSEELDRIVNTVADKTRNDSSELVLGGHAAEIGLESVEPQGFDVRTRGAHAGLTDFEEWLVLKNAPIAESLGYTATTATTGPQQVAFMARSFPVRIHQRLNVRRGRS